MSIGVKEFLKEEYEKRDNYIVRTVGFIIIGKILSSAFCSISWKEFFSVSVSLLLSFIVIKIFDYQKWVQRKFEDLKKASTTN